MAMWHHARCSEQRGELQVDDGIPSKVKYECKGVVGESKPLVDEWVPQPHLQHVFGTGSA